MLGLIENEIKRDLAQMAVEALDNIEDYDEQEEGRVSDDSADKSEKEYEDRMNPRMLKCLCGCSTITSS